MKKPTLPALPPLPNPQLAEYLVMIRANLDIITGRRGGRIAPLPAGASNDEIVAKINEILERLQG